MRGKSDCVCLVSTQEVISERPNEVHSYSAMDHTREVEQNHQVEKRGSRKDHISRLDRNVRSRANSNANVSSSLEKVRWVVLSADPE